MPELEPTEEELILIEKEESSNEDLRRRIELLEIKISNLDEAIGELERKIENIFSKLNIEFWWQR